MPFINKTKSTSTGSTGSTGSQYQQTVEKYEFPAGTISTTTWFDSSSNGGTYFIQVPNGLTAQLASLKGNITEGSCTAPVTLTFKKNNLAFATFNLVTNSTIGVYSSTYTNPINFSDNDQITVSVSGNEPTLGFVAFLTLKFS